MTKAILFFCVVCFFTITLQAHTLKGVITDAAGHPIPFATAYIRETASGIVANEQGEFLSHLKKGNYTGEFSALGYEKTILPFTISDKETTLRITLHEKMYSLKEVIIDGKGEDPAYAIMRKAIAYAPFYRYQVKTYLADIYIKGMLKTGKLPSFGSVIVGDQRVKIKTFSNKLFLMESQNEVRFTAPNTYDQKVIAISTTIPDELDDEDAAMQIMTNNVYDPELFGVTSPLAPGAFSYYKFTLEGVATEGSRVINKIRVTPKKNNNQLANGWLYILDHTWNLQHIDFKVNQAAVSFHNNVSFHEVKPDVWLPTTYDMNMKINMLGIKVEGKYYSSVQYKQVEVNEMQIQTSEQILTLPAQEKREEKQPTKKELKAHKKLEELAAKKELTTREAYKMAQLMEETAETPEIKKEKKSLEIQPWDSAIHITRDSLAMLRDTGYWNKIRTQPLQADEILSYQWKDSLKRAIRSEAKNDSLKRRTFGKRALSLLMGEKIKLNKHVTLGYDGLLRASPEYNFVDGFWLGQQLMLTVDLSRKRSLKIVPEAYYTTARKNIVWQISGSLRYDPMRRGRVTVSAGDITEDYAGRNGTNRFINAFASLLFAENAAKLYRKQFADITHHIDVANGLRLSTSMLYEKRRTLGNKTSYSIFGGSPHANIPHGYASAPMPDHTAWIANIRLDYTPRYYYRIWKGEKIYDHSKFPTFTLRYRQGIPFANKRNTSFTMLSASVLHTVRLNLFNRLFYGIDAGIFPSAKEVYLPDFKHFITGEIHVTDKPMQTSFNLIDNYRYATNDKWLQGHIMFSSDYLLLKHVRFMQNYLFDEALHLHSLWITGRNYSEAGYSIGISNLGRIGVFAGFDNGHYDHAGFIVSLPLIQFFKQNNR